jgi:hypothetical protein
MIRKDKPGIMYQNTFRSILWLNIRTERIRKESDSNENIPSVFPFVICQREFINHIH